MRGYRPRRRVAIAFTLAAACFTCTRLPAANAPQPRVLTAAGEAAGACAIVDSGRVHCWQRGARFWVQGIADAVQVATYEAVGCVLRRSGRVSCWDYSGYFGKDTVHAEDVAGLDAPSRIAVTDVRACAVVAGATVSCWETHRYPQERMTPAPVPTFTDVVDLSIYGAAMLALRKDGTLATGSIDYAPSRSLADVAEVSMGDHFACARRHDGSVWCWGDNWMGRLGDGTLIARPDPRAVAGISNAIGVGVGVGHGCALRADGVVLCWGSNTSGELGVDPRGSSDRRETPIAVPDVRARSLSVVRYGACVVTTTQALVCWGYGHGARRMEISPPDAP